MKKNKKTFSWKRLLLSVLCVILALILVVLVGATVYVQHLYDQIETINTETISHSEALEQMQTEETETMDPTFTGEVLDATDVTMPEVPAETIATTDNVINILLVGQDRRTGQSRQRSDAMILVTINKAQKTITLTSFLRDLYVSIPGFWNQRLNAAYVYGGFKTLNDTLEYNFGVRSDYNVEVDFDGFTDVINLVGGVGITLTGAEARHLNGQNSSWALVEGYNVLDGDQALAYSRIRYLDSDFGRTQRQRNVITSLIKQAMSMNLTQLNNLVSSVLPMVATDMELEDVTGLLVDIFPMLSEMTIKTQSIPADGTYSFAWVDGMAVIMPNFDKNIEILKDILSE